MPDLDGEVGSMGNIETETLEEREARTMASTTVLRRDLAPIVSVRVVQENGGHRQQVTCNTALESIRSNFVHVLLQKAGGRGKMEREGQRLDGPNGRAF